MDQLLLITETKLLILCIISIIIFINFLKHKKTEKQNAKAALGIFINFIISICLLYYLKDFFNISHLFTTVSILFSSISILILKIFKVYKKEHGILFTFIIIASVSLGYISYTPYWARQHDSRDFHNYSNGGHFGYISYIYHNNQLPTESPKEYWCFYNPPLFYIISALFMKIYTLFNNVIEAGLENLQIFSFFYALTFEIYVYKILKEMNIKKSLIQIMLFIGLSPAVLILSGSLNNDILSIMLSAMSIYYTIIWYKTDTLKDLIKIALTISLAMMTKISSALIAVAIACAFLSKVIKNRKDIKRYIIHFSIFALISLPIGLWFPIRNLIKYDMPLTYVQSVDESNDANISKYSILERFININPSHLNSINIDMSRENAEYNLYTTTLKSYIIDEHIDYEEKGITKFVVHFMFYMSIITTLLYLINIINIIIKHKEIENKWIYFFGLLLILQIISYLKFCFDFPFTFTMNFRYIVPTLISFGVFMGISSDKNNNLCLLNNVCLTFFSILSIIMFTNII